MCAMTKNCCIVLCVTILVVITVAILLSFFVIAPAIGNHAMKTAVLTITNATVTNVTIMNLQPFQDLQFSNSFLLDNKMSLNAKLGAVNVTLTGLTNESNASSEFVLGYNKLPDMDLSAGDNKEYVDSPWEMPATNTDFINWALPLAGGLNHTVYQRINFNADVELTALGIFKLHPNFDKTVCCTQITNPVVEATLTMSLGCTQIDDLSAPCNKDSVKFQDEQRSDSESNFLTV